MATPASPKVTFAQAAQLAGVSRSAISIVINNRAGVSENTRRRVEKILARIGYSPAPLARRRGVRKALVGRLHRVGILIVGFNSKKQMKEHAKVFWNAITSAFDEIERLGAMPELVFLPDPKNPPTNLLNAGYDGWIGIGAMPEPKPWPEFLRKHLNPIVWMPCSAGLGWGDAVGINQESTGVMAAHYLYDVGVRTAAVIGQVNTRPMRTRTDSFVLRFQQMGGEIVPMRAFRSFHTRSRTPDHFAVDLVVDDLFRAEKRADGIFVTSDCFVPEVYMRLRRNSCKPGIDIKIIGCNNELEYFRGLTPKPATIDIRAEEIAARAVRQLWWRRLNPGDERFAVILEPRLVLPVKPADLRK